MKEIALRAIEELNQKYKPAFIVLYGSIPRGDFTEESDIDVACFCESPSVSKDASTFEGKKLDCWLYSLDDIDPTKKGFLRFVGGEIYLDANGTGVEFLAKLTKFFEAGPKPMSEDAKTHLVEWTRKTLRRAQKGDIEARYRQTELLYTLLEIYFELRQQWFLGSKQSFHWLQQHDPSVYQLFERALYQPADLNCLGPLIDAVIAIK